MQCPVSLEESDYKGHESINQSTSPVTHSSVRSPGVVGLSPTASGWALQTSPRAWFLAYFCRISTWGGALIYTHMGHCGRRWRGDSSALLISHQAASDSRGLSPMFMAQIPHSFRCKTCEYDALRRGPASTTNDDAQIMRVASQTSTSESLFS